MYPHPVESHLFRKQYIVFVTFGARRGKSVSFEIPLIEHHSQLFRFVVNLHASVLRTYFSKSEIRFDFVKHFALFSELQRSFVQFGERRRPKVYISKTTRLFKCHAQFETPVFACRARKPLFAAVRRFYDRRYLVRFSVDRFHVRARLRFFYVRFKPHAFYIIAPRAAQPYALPDSGRSIVKAPGRRFAPTLFAPRIRFRIRIVHANFDFLCFPVFYVRADIAAESAVTAFVIQRELPVDIHRTFVVCRKKIQVYGLAFLHFFRQLEVALIPQNFAAAMIADPARRALIRVRHKNF